jgi:uncharacterized membrane protein
MRNKDAGYLISGIGIVILIIVYIFNNGLKNVVSQTCSHGPTCTMYDTITLQTWISLALAGLVLIIGLVLIFSKEHEKIIIQKVKEKTKKKKLDLSKLDSDEKKVIELLQKENRVMFQASLTEELNLGKVKITRLLDKLEAKQFIERKRRGMNNIVVLKNS